jgi:hypothetical protein
MFMAEGSGIVNRNSRSRKKPIGNANSSSPCLGGVPESSAGNVANTQPHVPRLIRAGTPPSSFVYACGHPVRIKRVGLGSRGKAPGTAAKQPSGVRGEAPIITCKGANKCLPSPTRCRLR